MRQGLFTKDAPFQTVEEYTEWWLEKKGLYDMTEFAVEMAEEHSKMEREQAMVELVPLHTARTVGVNQIEVLETVLDEVAWYPVTSHYKEVI